MTRWNKPQRWYRRTFMATCLTVVMCVLAPQQLAQGAKPGSGDPPPLALSQFRTLEFGSASATTSGSGTVTITAAGGKSTSGFAIDMGGAHRAAEFKITGPNNQAITITLPTSVQISDGSSTITLHSFTSNPSGTATLSNRGKLTLYVGATADIGTGQNANDYTGSFTVFVDEVP